MKRRNPRSQWSYLKQQAVDLTPEDKSIDKFCYIHDSIHNIHILFICHEKSALNSATIHDPMNISHYQP